MIVPFAVSFTLVLAVMAQPVEARENVALLARPATKLDATARQLTADELARAARNGDAPLVLIGEARLGGAKDRTALFIQLQSARECGSAGCSTSVYVWSKDKWRMVLDSVAGPISVDTARHGGMHDLIVDRNHRWIWQNDSYVDTRPAPKVDLRLRQK